MTYPSQISREAILQKAQEKLEKSGKIGLRQLAQELGVKAPSLYRYFPSQKALEKAVAVEGYRQLGADLQKVADKNSSTKTLAHAYRKFALGHARLYHLMHDPHVVMDQNHEVVSFLLGPISKVLEIDMKDPKNREKFVLMLRTLRSYVHGFVSLEMAGHFILGGNVEKSFEEGFLLITEAFEKRAHGG